MCNYFKTFSLIIALAILISMFLAGGEQVKAESQHYGYNQHEEYLTQNTYNYPSFFYNNPGNYNYPTQLYYPSSYEIPFYACQPYAFLKCISNISYWHDSCGALQTIAQNCNNTGQICQKGYCVNNPFYKPPAHQVPIAEKPNNNCYNNYNQLKCDGSTCKIGSSDYNKYCEKKINENESNLEIQNQSENQGVLSISIFGENQNNKNDVFQQNISGFKDDQINFLIILKNNSNTSVNNVSVRVNPTANLNYTGNLKIGNLGSAGNIISGITLGSLPPKKSEIISFTGVINNQNFENFQISANILSASIVYDSDFLIVNEEQKNNINNKKEGSLLENFKKNWLLWGMIAVILITVFIVIFRRLSSNV